MSKLADYEEKLAAATAERARDDLRAILATAEGRRFAWSILASAGVYGRSFTGEPLTTAHNEGRREVGLQLLERIEAQAPGSYLAMLREGLDDQTLIENARRIARDQDKAEQGDM